MLRFTLPLLLLFLPFFSVSQTESSIPRFRADVQTEQKPWTHLNFQDDPDHFQFAIVSDNTGGMRPGVFESAVVKLNMLRPEFVMSVGDLIEGYTDNRRQIDKEWDEFNGAANELQMPFFYVPGNHDISNLTMQADWEERYGVRYYSFVYKDVLFLMLDTDDAEGGTAWFEMTEEQEAYLLQKLEEHTDVRWTLFFMHHPMWTQEDNKLEAIEEKLKESGRGYTMFAGHEHRYMSEMRKGREYYTLATTGGGSRLRGPRFGEFDHITWVTMTDEGPVMANLWLDGILDMDVHDEKVKALADALAESTAFEHLMLTNDGVTFEHGRLLLKLKNTSDRSIRFRGSFTHHHQVNILNALFIEDIPPQDHLQVDIPLEAIVPVDTTRIEALRLHWSVSYPDSEYPDLTLSGTTRFAATASTFEPLASEQQIFTDALELQASEQWGGLNLHYSDKSTLPERSDPIVTNAVMLYESSNLTFRLFDEKGACTRPANKAIAKVEPRVPVALSSTKPGMNVRIYGGRWKELPDFERLKPLRQEVAEQFDPVAVSGIKEGFGLVFSGFIKVDEEGVYLFATTSDDGSKLYIGGDLVVHNDGLQSATTKQGYIALSPGYHPIRIEYFERGGDETLEVFWQQPGSSKLEPLPISALVRD